MAHWMICRVGGMLAECSGNPSIDVSTYLRTIVWIGSLHMGHGQRLCGLNFFIVLRMHVVQYLCPQFVSEMVGVSTVSMQMGQSMDSCDSSDGPAMRLFM